MLKAFVKDINEISDEALRNFYVEKDGKFVLNVTPVDGYELDNVHGLKTALGAERNSKRDLEDRLKIFDGIDPDQARKAFQDVERLNKDLEKFSKLDPEKEAEKLAEEKLKNHRERMRAREEELNNEFGKKENGYKEALARRESQLKKLMVDHAIETALTPLNPLDDARDAIALLAAQAVRIKEVNGEYVVEVLDEKGNPRIKDGYGTPFGIGDYLAEVREKRPSLFKAENKHGIGFKPTNGGGGAVGGAGGGKNPWAKDSWNITEQMSLTNTNPALAQRLKSEAGVAQ